MIRHLRRLYRFLLLFLCIFTGLFAGLAARCSRRPEYWSQRWFRSLLRALNVQVEVTGLPARTGALVAGNHVSWLDIALLVSAKPVIFVSKAEVSQWPVAGWLARSGETLFIERGAHGTQHLNEQISALLAQGRSVVIFPEGTTTRGPGVRRFHSRLFAGAINSHRQVLPFALRYRQACVPYVDDQSLGQNLWALLAEPVIHAELRFGPLIPPAERRDHLARQTQRWVERSLSRPPPWTSTQSTAPAWNPPTR